MMMEPDLKMMRHIKRFEGKYEKHESGCWLWLGGLNQKGYGLFYLKRKSIRAHRFAYELYKKPIESECLDHLCKVRNCVNPEHLEEVTIAENVKRGMLGQRTHCNRGHELVGDNVYLAKKGKRVCRTCNRAYRKKKPT